MALFCQFQTCATCGCVRGAHSHWPAPVSFIFSYAGGCLQEKTSAAKIVPFSLNLSALIQSCLISEGNIVKLQHIYCQWEQIQDRHCILILCFCKCILESVPFAASRHLEFTAQTRSSPICPTTWYSYIRHVFFLPPSSSLAVWGGEGGNRHKSSSERCKDYFHSSRAVPLMRLTQKWMRHYMAHRWHDRIGIFFFARWMRPD